MDVMDFSNSGSAPAAAPATSPSTGSTPAPSSPVSAMDRFKATAMKEAAKHSNTQPGQQAPTQEPEKSVDNPAQGEPANKPAQEEVATPSGKENQKVVEYNGRRFDFSKPEVVAKKLVDLETGMRKAFAERDGLKKQLADMDSAKPSEEEAQTTAAFSNVMKAWNIALQNNQTVAGVDHVINSMIPQEHLNAWLQKQLQHHSHLLNLDPQERQQYLSQYEDRTNFERERLDVMMQKAEITGERQAREQAEVRAAQKEMEATINPIFQKHSFASTIKDKRTAEFLDKQLWAETQPRLVEYVEANGDLPSAIVEQILKGVRSELQLGQESAAKAHVSQAVAAKKQDAMQAVNVAMSPNGQAQRESPADMIKNNNHMGAFSTRLQGLMGIRK